MIISQVPDNANNQFLAHYQKAADVWNDYINTHKGHIEGNFTEYGLVFWAKWQKDGKNFEISSKKKMENVATDVIPVKSPVVGQTRLSFEHEGRVGPFDLVKKSKIKRLFLRRKYNEKTKLEGKYVLYCNDKSRSEILRRPGTLPENTIYWKSNGKASVLYCRSFLKPEQVEGIFSNLTS
jgi:hypothetical protein